MSEQPDPAELPEDVALLWGLRSSTRRGPKPTLSVDDITKAAVDLADAEGLAAVSMARVAQKLGNSTMALYRHVKSKDELLLLMADAALEEPPEFPPDERDWRAALTTWSNGVLAAIRRHAWWVQIPTKGPPIGPHNLAWFDRALSTFAHTSLREDEKVQLVMSLLMYIHGEVWLGTQLPEQGAQFVTDYGTALGAVVDPRKLPSLANVVAAGVFTVEPGEIVDSGDDWDFGLNVVLDGIGAYIARREGSA
ncbi:TetR/AcrR family transcriptional regulator [Tenggerimyces flavus]|uniref:TetR/AcrR family transcriptional regulator n=1 Tax=Tenggerimyces flavus TaxID=1708749 RepID=A0ABV7YFX2_9ACTN|nr:TetR/AcrR family transcriptional regulator [Tenggerimyces flavus]MBM7784025.1 AcrR family transcriptional regulator [Tenggerimyces flavus]